MNTPVGVLCGVLLATAVAVAGTPARADSITIAIGTEPSTLDPHKRDDGGERAINDNVYEALMARMPDGTLVPRLAAEPPVQVDPATWEFKLRPGITFHNGEPLNADAVVHSVLRLIDPALKSEQMAYFGTIQSAEKVDDLTVRIITSGADPILPARMYWMKIVAPGYSADPAFDSVPMGTGPYRFGAWSRGSDITLTADPDYWGGAPEIDDVTFRFVSEPGTRMSGLMAGELDLIPYLLPEYVDAVPQAASVEGLETSVLILSTENPATKDPRVRLALNLAVDRQALADSLFVGRATPTRGQLVNPRAFGYNAALEPYPYDPEAARALLKEAGAAGATVVLVGESGRWLKDREMIEAVGAYWSEIGIKPDIRIEEFSQWLTQFFDQAQRPDSIFVVSSDELLDADRPMTVALESGVSAASNGDLDMKAKIIAARTETDVEKRKALYAEIAATARDGAYLLPLLNHQDIYGLSERLKWTPRTDGKLFVKEMTVTEAE